jgi:hypothetical protein
MLFYPFKEQLYLPAIFIKKSNLSRRYFHIIGQESFYLSRKSFSLR